MRYCKSCECPFDKADLTDGHGVVDDRCPECGDDLTALPEGYKSDQQTYNEENPR